MKTIFTLLTFTLLVTHARSQVILNEIYPVPGNGRHEFFELYNNSPSSSPVSVDGYTLVSYFEEPGNRKGFYVIDLPNLTIASRGHFVGAAAMPFNYQGIINCTAAQFSWNNGAFLNANNGSFKKWVFASAVPAATDGNAQYDEEPVPAGINDFFMKIGGGSASYNALLFKDGVLVSAFFGGMGGSNSVPSYLTTMPNLNVDMAGTSTDFSIPFSTFGSFPAEYVISEAGTDNGYIRQRDGFCGAWTKSSAQINHTPGSTNGGETFFAGEISVASAVITGSSATGSKVNYDVVSAPSTAFPVTLQVYVDNGTTAGVLDGSDSFIEYQVDSALNNGGFTTTFFPHDRNILIVVTSSAGCIDRIMFVPTVGVLPVKLESFTAKTEESLPLLQWTVNENESGAKFEVEASPNSRNFTTLARINGTGKAGREQYSYKDVRTVPGNTYYRLKMTGKDNVVTYSQVVSWQGSGNGQAVLKTRQNPVYGSLQLQYAASTSSTLTISIYNITGGKQLSWHSRCDKGNNTLTLSVDGKLAPGYYVAEVREGGERTTTAFIKQ